MACQTSQKPEEPETAWVNQNVITLQSLTQSVLVTRTVTGFNQTCTVCVVYVALMTSSDITDRKQTKVPKGKTHTSHYKVLFQHGLCFWLEKHHVTGCVGCIVSLHLDVILTDFSWSDKDFCPHIGAAACSEVQHGSLTQSDLLKEKITA